MDKQKSAKQHGFRLCLQASTHPVPFSRTNKDHKQSRISIVFPHIQCHVQGPTKINRTVMIFNGFYKHPHMQCPAQGPTKINKKLGFPLFLQASTYPVPCSRTNKNNKKSDEFNCFSSIHTSSALFKDKHKSTKTS